MDNKAFNEDGIVMTVQTKMLNEDKRPNGSTLNIHSVSTMPTDEIRPIQVNRTILNTENVWNNVYTQSQCKPSNTKNVRKRLGLVDSIKKYTKIVMPPGSLSTNNEVPTTWFGVLRNFMPILHWIPNYNIKRDLIHDLITGITMLTVHIPEGMAFGKLAGVGAINGLYVSLFPVIIYTIFGSSKHVSIGTFAVISIACKHVIQDFYANYQENEAPPTPSEILTTLAFFIGCIQFGLSLLQLGVMAIVLSNSVISGFVVGASVLAFTNEIFTLVGLDSYSGSELQISIPFGIIKNWINFFLHLPKTNIPTLILTIVCISLLALGKYWLEPFLIKKYKLKNVILPIGIVLIIVTTILSWFFYFNEKYKIEIFPEIPKTFVNLPTVPRFEYMPRVYAPAILISLVTFTTTYSVGKMYSRLHGYEVSANQELMALGAANLFSSFFLCYPCAGSISRSAVQDRVGGRTQLATLVSSILMVIFLLHLTSLLHTLPMCVLSSIIVVALISILQRFREFIEAWRFSKLDGILSFATFSLVVLLGIGQGLLLSVLFSFVILIIRLANPGVNLKRHVTETELFLEVSKRGFTSFRESFIKHASPQGWIVFEYQGPFIYINSNIFRNKFYQRVGRFIVEAVEEEKSRLSVTGLKMQHKSSKKLNIEVSMHESAWNQLPRVHTIIFDCSRVTYIDSRATEVLLDVIRNMAKYGARVLLTSLTETVYYNLHQLNFFDKYSLNQCYLTVIDAVTDIETQNNYQPLPWELTNGE